MSSKLPGGLSGLLVFLALTSNQHNECRGFAFGPPLALNRRSACQDNIVLWAELQDNTGSNADDARRRRQRQIPYYSAADSDFMPKRETGSRDNDDQHYSQSAVHDWGIEQYSQRYPSHWTGQDHYHQPEFPSTLNSVADAAFEAISATLHQEQRLDPNLASNAMQSSIFDYRPTKQPEDLGRLGIELDGVHHLLSHTSTSTSSGMDHQSTTSNLNALRQLILVLAGKLSNNLIRDEDHDDNNSVPPSCPVAIYFNTVKQALAASQQLQILQQQQQQQSSSHASRHPLSPTFQNITILCLSQNDDLPGHMMIHNHTLTSYSPSKKGRKPKRPRPKTGTLPPGIHPEKGIVIVVQPTDFNQEFKPPGPAVGVVSSFQRLVARASLEGLPVIMVSPRLFTMMEGNPQNDFVVGAAAGRGWDQSVASQQAATYGGLEPPSGPTPWILRDFNPPVYCWVGNAVPQLQQRSPGQQRHIRGSSTRRTNNRYSQIALTQTVMDEGHPWHVFAARKELVWDSSSNDRHSNSERRPQERVVYDYLASTKPSSGRPTRDILHHILYEFGDDGGGAKS